VANEERLLSVLTRLAGKAQLLLGNLIAGGEIVAEASASDQLEPMPMKKQLSASALFRRLFRKEMGRI
jgi:hypothetical protein